MGCVAFSSYVCQTNDCFYFPSKVYYCWNTSVRLGEEKDAPSLWIMIFQLQKYLNDLLQNIVLRAIKEERTGGRGQKEEKKENRRKVTTNFDVSFMT